MIKKYLVRGLGFDGNDAYFVKLSDARHMSKLALTSGRKRIVHIARFEKKLHEDGESLRKSYLDIEMWGIANGTPKMKRM